MYNLSFKVRGSPPPLNMSLRIRLKNNMAAPTSVYYYKTMMGGNVEIDLDDLFSVLELATKLAHLYALRILLVRHPQKPFSYARVL